MNLEQPKSKIESCRWESDFDAQVENYVQSITWSADASDEEKTLVNANIRGFASYIKKQLGSLPTTTYQAGIDEAVEVIKTMYKDISGDVLSATGFPEAVDYGYNQALDDTIKALQNNKKDV